MLQPVHTLKPGSHQCDNFHGSGFLGATTFMPLIWTSEQQFSEIIAPI